MPGDGRRRCAGGSRRAVFSNSSRAVCSRSVGIGEHQLHPLDGVVLPLAAARRHDRARCRRGSPGASRAPRRSPPAARLRRAARRPARSPALAGVRRLERQPGSSASDTSRHSGAAPRLALAATPSAGAARPSPWPGGSPSRRRATARRGLRQRGLAVRAEAPLAHRLQRRVCGLRLREALADFGRRQRAVVEADLVHRAAEMVAIAAVVLPPAERQPVAARHALAADLASRPQARR